MKHDLEMADLFAGGGGFSTGIAEACKQIGRNPSLVAINHWKVAVDTHRRNHPWARHLCTGIESVNPTDVAPARLNLLAASPECTDHSNARGGRPCNNQKRASAWLILKWLQEIYVEAVLIENVEEFCKWGPLGANGRPLKSMRGTLFDQFISSLKALGYNVEWRVLNAANYGGATTRERLFIMARRGRNKRILWPDQSHSRLGDIQPDMFGDKKRWRPAREIIDWTVPSRSIFTRKKPLAPATLERIAAGLRKFGGKNAEPFLVVLRNHMGAQSLSQPVPTLTASGEHVGLCQPFIAELRGGKTANSLNDPLSTITTKGAHHALIQPFVMSMEHACKPFAVQLVHGRDPNGGGHERRTHDIDSPMPTITTVDAWGVVEPFMVEYHGNHRGRKDGDRRARSLDDPLPTQTTENRFGLAQPFIVPFFGERGGQTPRSHSLDDPLPTVTSHGAGGLVEPFLVSYYGTGNVSTVGQPLPTVTAKDRFGLVECDGYALDIHFRMLSWRELASAMGFPEWYEFEGTRSDKVRQIGNSVEVRTAKALALAALAS